MGHGGKHSILIVEDSKDLQLLIGMLLRNEPYEVKFASGGKEAIEILQKPEWTPDLILLDLVMSDMDGYEFRRIQKETPAIASIPVVVMSAHADVHLRAAELEAKAFLRKPFGAVDQMLATLASSIVDKSP